MQASGLTRDRRDALLAECGTDLRGLRNRALVAVGYDTLCRRSELAALRVEDLEPRRGGGYDLLVRRLVTSPVELARRAWISAESATHLRRWLDAARVESGPVFRPVYQGVPICRFLNSYTIVRVLKELSDSAGLSSAETAMISGHSLRIGAAQDLASGGRDILTIMRAGGWSGTNVLLGYLEHADLQLWD